jgi:hypothetical protein
MRKIAACQRHSSSIAVMTFTAPASAKTSLATVTACVLLIALAPAANAASKPKFDKYYEGTLSGSTTTKYDDGDVLDAVWSVAHVKLKLRKTRAEFGGWMAIYKVTGGTVNFSEIKTGMCTHSVTDSFPLVSGLPKHPASGPLALNRNSSGDWLLYGGIQVDNTYNSTEFCADPGGGPPIVSPVVVTLPQLFDPTGGRAKPGQRIHGKYHDSNTAGSSTVTTVRNWNLKPR